MQTAARVNIEVQNNATFQDAFQFGNPGDTWTLTGQSFRMDIKASKYDTAALLSLTSAASEIIVADAVNRVIYFNVPEATITANLPVAEYVYDLVMIDTSTPAIRVPLMQGEFKVRQGVTGG